MINSRILATVAILAAMPAVPVPAQTSVHEVGVHVATKLWPAPVGHRQPRVIDVPALSSASQDFFEQEDANVDRKIGGVCRGC